MFNTADEALELSSLSDEDLLAEALVVLGIMFEEENVANVLSYVRTNWSQDPYSQMSYSGMGLDSKYPRDCKNIQKKIKGRLYFAGEHTNCELYATTAGAYVSGHIAASDVMKDL